MIFQRILTALDKGLVGDIGEVLFEHFLEDGDMFQEILEQCWDSLTDEDAELQLLDEGFHFRGFKKNDNTKRIWLDQVKSAFQQSGQPVPMAPVRPVRPKQFASRELTGGAPPPRVRRIIPKAKIRERDE